MTFNKEAFDNNAFDVSPNMIITETPLATASAPEPTTSTNYVSVTSAPAVVSSTPAIPPIIKHYGISGTGTSSDPYMLRTFCDLELIGDTNHSLGAYYQLDNDISAFQTQAPDYKNGTGWNPIGTSSTPFTGNFDGKNYAIYGLYINRSSVDGIGLFGYIRYANIKNIILDKRIGSEGITGHDSIGGIVGHVIAGTPDPSVSNCTNKIPVTGNNNIGGIVGETDDATNIIYLNNNITNTIISGASNVGGIVGLSRFKYQNLSQINNNDVQGTINATGNCVGGIIGIGMGITLQNNTVHNLIINVSSISDYIGGIQGDVYGYGGYDANLKDNTVTVDVAGRDYVGGLLGGTDSIQNNKITIIGNKYTGVVAGRNFVGGLVGCSRYTWSDSLIDSNDVSGTVNATGNYVGGLAGHWVRGVSNQDITSLTITVSSSSNYVGGLIGYISNNANNDTNITNCHVKINISGQDCIGGFVGGVDIGGHFLGIDTSSFNGNLAGRNYIGGFVGSEGFNSGSTIQKLVSIGSVTSSGQYSGSILGWGKCNVQNSYSTMEVNGITDVGGLIGCSEGQITNCYSVGKVTGTTNVGGFVGRINSGGVSSSYWNIETSGKTTSALGTGLTSLQMTCGNNYSAWDFTSIWKIDANTDYPILKTIPYSSSNAQALPCSTPISTNSFSEVSILTNAPIIDAPTSTTICSGSLPSVGESISTGWNYKTSVTITGSSDKILEDYAVRITIPYTDGKMKSDFGDIRFTDANGLVLDYFLWSKTDSSTASFLVKISQIPLNPDTVTINIFSGNSSATDGSNPNKIYDWLYQPSGTAIDATKIAQTSGTVSVSDGNLIIKQGWAKLNGTFTPPFIIERRFTPAVVTGNDVRFGINVNSTPTDPTYACYWAYSSGSWYSNGTTYTADKTFPVKHEWAVYSTSSYKIFHEGVLKYTNTSAGLPSGALTLYMQSGTFCAANLNMTFIGIRKATPNEPTVGALGAWEQTATPATIDSPIATATIPSYSYNIIDTPIAESLANSPACSVSISTTIDVGFADTAVVENAGTETDNAPLPTISTTSKTSGMTLKARKFVFMATTQSTSSTMTVDTIPIAEANNTGLTADISFGSTISPISAEADNIGMVPDKVNADRFVQIDAVVSADFTASPAPQIWVPMVPCESTALANAPEIRFPRIIDSETASETISGLESEVAGNCLIESIAGEYSGNSLAPEIRISTNIILELNSIDNCCALYPLKDGTDLISGQNGTVYNNPTKTTGLFDGGLTFNGSNQYIQIPRVVGDTNFSIAFYLKTTATGGSTGFWYNGLGLIDAEVGGVTNDFGSSIGGGKLMFGIGNADTTLTSTSKVNDGNYHFIVFTRDMSSGRMEIWIDGSLNAYVTGPTGAKTTSSTIQIAKIRSGTNYFPGTIEQIAFFKKVLTSDEINLIKNKKMTVKSGNTIYLDTRVFREEAISMNYPEVRSFEDYSSWNYKSTITITGSSDGVLTDFLVPITIPYNANYMKSDFGDIRFTLEDNSVLKYAIDSKTDGSTATFLVKIPSIPAGPNTLTINVYSGNSSISTSSDDSIYNGLDTFSGTTLDLSDWTWIRENSSLWDLTSQPGKLKIATAGTEIYGGTNNCPVLKRVSALPTNFEMTCDFSGTPNTNYQRGGLYGYSDDSNYFGIMSRYGNGRTISSIYETGGSPSEKDSSLSNDNYSFKITKIGTSVKTYYNTGSGWTLHQSYTVADITYYGALISQSSAFDGGSVNFFYDNFKIIPATQNQPTVGTQSEWTVTHAGSVTVSIINTPSISSSGLSSEISSEISSGITITSTISSTNVSMNVPAVGEISNIEADSICASANSTALTPEVEYSNILGSTVASTAISGLVPSAVNADRFVQVDSVVGAEATPASIPEIITTQSVAVNANLGVESITANSISILEGTGATINTSTTTFTDTFIDPSINTSMNVYVDGAIGTENGIWNIPEVTAINNEIWLYKSTLTITGSTDGAQTDLPISITVPYDANYMRTDFGDIRFGLPNGTVLNYCIDSKTDSSTATFLVKIPNLPASPGTITVNMYSGNANATTTSDPKSVYLTYDTCDDSSLDTSIWTKDVSIGTISEDTDGLKISLPTTATDWWGGVTCNAPVVHTSMPSGNWMTTVKLVSKTEVNDTNAGIVLYSNKQNAWHFVNEYFTEGSVHGLLIAKIVNNTATDKIATNSATTQPIWFRMTSVSGRYTFLYSTDGKTFTTLYTTTNLGITPTQIGLFSKNWGGAAITSVFKDFKSLKITGASPTVSIGVWQGENVSVSVVPSVGVSTDTFLSPGLPVSVNASIAESIDTSLSPSISIGANVAESITSFSLIGSVPNILTDIHMDSSIGVSTDTFINPTVYGTKDTFNILIDAGIGESEMIGFAPSDVYGGTDICIVLAMERPVLALFMPIHGNKLKWPLIDPFMDALIEAIIKLYLRDDMIL